MLLPPEQVTRLDDKHTADGQLCFTDGCGLISRRLAQQVATAWDATSTSQHVPSALQIRYHSAKGVLAVCPSALEERLLGHFDVALRPSQVKFDAPHSLEPEPLEVCSIAVALPFFLNRQIIPCLAVGGVKDEAFLTLLDEQSAELHAARHDSKLALQLVRRYDRHQHAAIQLLEAGVDIRSEPFVGALIGSIIDCALVDMCFRFRLPVAQAARFMGIVDESNTLQAGTVFFQTRDSKRTLPPAGTRLAVGRDPSLHRGTSAFFRCPPLCLRNLRCESCSMCWFFRLSVLDPRQTKRAVVTSMVTFFVIWDSRFVPTLKHAPMEYVTPVAAAAPAAKAVASKVPLPADPVQPMQIDAVSDFFLSYMQNSSVGMIADAHAAHADRSEQGVHDHRCLKLAELHSAAVDFAKSGKPVVLPRMLQPRDYPSWMRGGVETPTVYRSSSLLGQLYARGQGMVEQAPAVRVANRSNRRSIIALNSRAGQCISSRTCTKEAKSK